MGTNEVTSGVTYQHVSHILCGELVGVKLVEINIWIVIKDNSAQ